MQLGNFSVSLAVKDIAAARRFYETLGFTQVFGNEAQRWLILQNATATIGLFQGPQYTRTCSRSIRVGIAPAVHWQRSTTFATFSGH